MAKHTLKMLLCSKIFNACLDISEAATGGVPWKKVLKKRLWQRCFPVNFAKFLKNTFFTDHLRMNASDISQHYAWKGKNLHMQFFWPEKWKLLVFCQKYFQKQGFLGNFSQISDMIEFPRTTDYGYIASDHNELENTYQILSV